MKNKIKMQKGITLVALIITIIVLLILAVVTINAVRGDGIIQKAASARDTYVAKADEEQGEINTYTEKIKEYVGEDKYTPIILEAGAVIPEGATYYVQASYYDYYDDSFFGTLYYGPEVGEYDGATEKLQSGKKMPNNPSVGDVFVYGDYEYRYGWIYTVDSLGQENNLLWDKCGDTGWGVRVLNDKKSEYSQLCETINGKSVKYLTYTFADTEITKTPILPAGIVDMSNSFKNTLITEAPNIPYGVTNMYGTFEGSSITAAPVIPNTVINMSGAFSGSAIKTASTIPNSVIDMYFTFFNCKFLEGEIEINAAIESSKDNRYKFCFNGTVKPIILTGTSPILQQLANTATNNNVSVK